MQKLILILVFALGTFSIQAATKQTNLNNQKNCETYAQNAVEAEYDAYEPLHYKILDQALDTYDEGVAQYYDYWYNACVESGGSLGDPIFL